jgi:hypothetical protein
MSSIHPLLQSFIDVAPFLNKMRENGYMIGITDREKTLLFVPNKIIDIKTAPNTILPSDDPMLKVMSTGEPLLVRVPKDLYGIPFKAYYLPLRDKANEIIGGFALGQELEIEEKVMEISELLFQSINQITGAVEQIARGSQDQEEISNEMVAVVDSSSVKYKETDNIIGFIKAVSNQTNMLSLNAQIEAARVGLAGKGFAVVANEMKKLGTNTSDAAKDIGNILIEIKSINHNIEELVEKNSLITNEQSSALEEILANIQELNSAISTLNEVASNL